MRREKKEQSENDDEQQLQQLPLLDSEGDNRDLTENLIKPARKKKRVKKNDDG